MFASPRWAEQAPTGLALTRVRRSTGKQDLRAPLDRLSQIANMLTKTPRVSRRPLRISAWALAGDRFERLRKWLGLRWTFLCLARARS